MEYKDYYNTLGVSRSATTAEIQKAFRGQARKYHPDVNKTKEAESQFKIINEAYEVLKDPEKRKQYDRLGSNWKNEQNFQPPPGWNPGFGGSPGRPQAGPAGQGVNFGGIGGGGFSDFFDSLFGGAAGRGPFQGVNFGGVPGGPIPGQPGPRGAAPSQDAQGEITITLEEAYRGAHKSIALRVSEPNAMGQLQATTRNYQVRIPPGIRNGQKIRLSGQAPGGAGDLYLKVVVAPHPLFRINGQDLETDLPVAPWEAALGGKVEVPTLDGPVQMSLPPGSQSGLRMRLRGKGMPNKDGGRGNLYAEIQIMVPKTLSPKEKFLFEELAKKSKFEPRKT